MKKTILILYTLHDTGSNIPFSDLKYQRCYEILYSTAAEQGIVFCRAPVDWYDHESGSFLQAWFFENRQWALKPNILPNVIYDKTAFGTVSEDTYERFSEKFPLINNPEFTKIAGDKYATSLLLPHYFKPYLLVPSESVLSEKIKGIVGEYVVIKPLSSSGGEGVIIDTAKNVFARQLSYPLILQEFIDSSHGIPGITPGHHDLRLVFINDELVYSYVRVPKAGSLLANVAQGGKMFIVASQNLPPSINPAIVAVQKAFARFPRKIYTIDLMFDESAHPWIVELNTMPGVYFEAGQEETRDRFYTKLIQTLREL